MENRLNPYIGPPPFSKADKDLFFGRDEEKRDLAAIITAHKEVLLYAQSGAGKSSLINAGLIPLLEERQDVKVLPVVIGLRGLTPDDPELNREGQNIFVYNCLKTWMGDQFDPGQIASMTIRSYLQNLRQGEDSPESPHLLLLIFDQFEEYLVQHQDRHKEKEAFFQKIAEALGGDPLQGLEGDPLLRVLFVIKEEFLAALDPYVDLLPDMLRTRYRLECLRQDGAIEAVEKPVDKLRGDQKTARSYAPGVAEKLVQKLLASDASEQEAPVSSEYVEPGQLQVVCIKLWEIPEKGEKQITEEHLKKLDVNKALTSFYEESLKAAVAASGVPEVELRRWFNEGLITSSGTRGMVFRGQETTEGIPNAAIDILDREKHIIRAEARASGSWYELTHDRLIEPIRKSNEEWLHSWDVKVAEDNLKKKYNRWLVIGFVGSLVLLVFAYWLHIYSEKDRVEGEIKRLQRKPAQVQLEQGERVAETIAAYLWEKRDPLPLYNPYCLDNVVLGPSLNRLIVNLKALQDVIPGPRRASLVESAEPQAQRTPMRTEYTAKFAEPFDTEEEESPFELRYDPERYPDKKQIQHQWQDLTKSLQSSWGIPVPWRLQLKADPALDKGEVKLRNKGILVPFKPDYLVISEEGLPVPLQELIKAHQKDWPSEKLEHIQGGPWRLVPHWTAPLFKVVKWKTYPQEYLVALKSGDNLIKNPDLVFPPDMVTYLLQYLHKRHPQTVDEALAARGGVEGIRTDLIELVRTGPLTDLRYLLDSLAKYPGVPSKQAAAQARMDQASARELFIDHSALLLPRPAQAQTSLLDTPGLELYKKAGVLTPLVKQEIKIYLGSGLFEKFITSDGELTPALQPSR